MTTTPTCAACAPATTRRAWIKRLVLGGATYAAYSGAWTTPAALGAPVSLTDRLRLNIATFPDLQLNGASIIITFDGGSTEILINRESETTFYALNPRCPHMACRVQPYSIATNTSTCPCHSSQFDIQGQLVQGPATTGLLPFATSFQEPATLHIEIPGLIHRLDQIARHSPTRLRLTFPTIPGAQYHIRHSPDLTSPFEVIPFAPTPFAPATQELLDGTGDETTLYIDTSTPTGFYVLELIISQLA